MMSFTGSVASGVMSFLGIVPAGGVYATLQSAAMGGYGAPIVAGAAKGAAAVAGMAYVCARKFWF